MKTAVITGGNSGIGKAAATELARKGYRVIIHGRDAAKTEAAASEIIAKSGNQHVESIAKDISTLQGMKELAHAIKQKTNKVHALVLSTGVILPKQVITSDGLELGFAIQYLSRFAITQLLMPELRNSGSARIVQVTAPKLKSAQIYFNDIAFKEGFTMMKAMGQEMYANHLMTQEFARRNPGKNIVINSLHVGIAKTGIMRETGFFLRLLVTLFGKSPEALCGNTVYLASDDSVDFSGYFLPKPGKPKVIVKEESDPETALRLWDFSMDLINSIL